MTADHAAAEQPFTVVLDDDETTVAEGRLRDLDAGPTWAKHRVTDHASTRATRAATPRRHRGRGQPPLRRRRRGPRSQPPLPEPPRRPSEFRKRLVATGVVAGALVVGVTAAQLSASAPTTPQAPSQRRPGHRPARTDPAAVNPHIPRTDRAATARTAPKLRRRTSPDGRDSSLTPAQVRDQQRHANKDAAGTSASSSESATQRHMEDHK